MNDEEKKPAPGPENGAPTEDAPEESLAARRLSHMDKEGWDRAYRDTAPAAVMTRADRVRNFWYHFKWPVIAAVLCVVVLLICIGQACGRETYDAYVLYAGPWLTCEDPAETNGVEEALRAVMGDYNGDGRRALSYRPIFYMTDDQLTALRDRYIAAGKEDEMPYIATNHLLDNRELYRNEIAAGEAAVCFLDRDMYLSLRDEGWLIPLTPYSDAPLPQSHLGDTGVYVRDTAFGQYFSAVAAMPEDTVLCLRKTGVLNQCGRTQESERLRTAHEELIRAILAFSAE